MDNPSARFFVALLLLLGASPGVALAAPADVALLKSYAGNYVGSGTLSGHPPQTVRCRFSLRGAGAGINYMGRCSAAGSNFSFTGVMSYVAARNHFEAAMTSSTGESSVAIGRRKGHGVVFSSRSVVTEGGHPRDVTSTLALTGGTLRVDFKVIDTRTGETSAGSIPFTKS